MRTSISAGARLLALSALLPTVAVATDSIGVVAVAEPPGPTVELAEVTHQLRVIVAERTQGVVEANELRERMTGQTSTATLAELDRAYAGALATYQNGDFEGAVRTLRAVVQDLERLPPGAEAFSQWTRAMLRLARCEQTLGRGGEARDILERLARANPTVKADATQYPPSFVKLVEDVKRQIAGLAKRKLTVSATAKGAKVFVEGREVGVTPLTIDLPPGRYRVSATLGNVLVPGVTADLTEEAQSVALNFALAEALRPGVGPGLALAETDRAKNLVAAGAWLGVDKLLATRFTTEAGVEYLSATMFDVRRGMLLREGRVRLANKVAPAGALSALASFLITGQSSELVAQTTAAPAPVTAQPAQKPRLDVPPPTQATKKPDVDFTARKPAGKSKALGWTAFSAGVASVGLGAFAIYSGMTANSKYGDASRMLLSDGTVPASANPADYRKLVSDGDSAKSRAYVTGGAAVGSAVVSGVLGYISYKRSGEFGPIRF